MDLYNSCLLSNYKFLSKLNKLRLFFKHKTNQMFENIDDSTSVEQFKPLWLIDLLDEMISIQ